MPADQKTLDTLASWMAEEAGEVVLDTASLKAGDSASQIRLINEYFDAVGVAAFALKTFDRADIEAALTERANSPKKSGTAGLNRVFAELARSLSEDSAQVAAAKAERSGW